MVWKESTVLGVGAAKGSDGSWYLVCTYKPPGNIVSKIGRNVLPRSYGLILLVSSIIIKAKLHSSSSIGDKRGTVVSVLIGFMTCVESYTPYYLCRLISSV